MKKTVVLLLAALMICCLAACASADRKDTQPELNPGDSNCEHIWTAWEVTEEQSCGQDGVRKRRCETCDREEEETLLALGHVYKDGRCLDCGRESQDCDHEETYDLVICEADCENKGETRVVCRKCKAAVDQKSISAYRHREWEVVTVREATCTEGSIEQYWCTICGVMIEEKQGPTKSHEYEQKDGLSPTCTEDGWTSYRRCTVCGYPDGYETLSAKGHAYVAGICCRCELVVEAFAMMDVPPFEAKLLNVSESVGKSYDVTPAQVNHFYPEFGSRQETYRWSFSASVKGTYVVWLDGRQAGCEEVVKLLDSDGNLLFQLNTRDGNCFVIELQQGEYTLEVFQGYPFSGYSLHVGHPSKPLDISGYNVIHDNMMSYFQSNTYTYTPETSGLYAFSLSGFTGGAEVKMEVRGENGRILEHRDNVNNGKSIILELEAGQTYTLYLENGPYISPYTLTVSTQRPVLDVTGYTSVADRVSYQSQQLRYSFVASDSQYTFLLQGMDDDSAFVKMYLYGPNGERLYNSDWCPNDSSVRLDNLVAGETYTIVVEQSHKLTDFVLHLLTPGEPVQIRDHVGIRDEMFYAGQTNAYRFTVERDDAYCFALDIHGHDWAGLQIEIYDSENQMINRYYLWDGEAFDMDFLEVGKTYTIYLTQTAGSMQYTFCIQK